MRSGPLIALALVIGGSLVGCTTGSSSPAGEEAPWKANSSGEVVTAAPDAGGPLSFRNCPTLDEARAAVPVLTGGPNVNAVAFKTLVLQCGYTMAESDVQGRPAGIEILVFDASADGIHLWDSVRTDPAFPDATGLPGLQEVAFATGTVGHNDVWVVQGGYGFHMSHTRRDGIPLHQMEALARAMLAGLGRPPR